MNRRNVTRLAFAIVILSFVLSTFVSLWSLQLMARQNVQELSKTLAARIYDSISSELSEPIVVSRTMANDRFLIRALENEALYRDEEIEALMADYLSGIRDSMRYEAAFVVSEGSLRYYSYGGLNKRMDTDNNKRDKWYVEFLASGKPYDVDVDRDEVGQDLWTVFADARVENKRGELLGACGVGVRLTGIQDLFNSLEREYGVKINLIDADGLVCLDTDETRIETTYLTDVRLSDSNDYIFQQVGQGRFAVSKFVDYLGWYLVVQMDSGHAREQVIHVIFLNVALCLLVLVILILAVRIIAARTRALSRASFVDQSTQLLNRRAFEEEKARLATLPLKEDFVYLTADLNGLKTANDTLGHAAGDELIRGAADCLKACLGKYGSVYRIGGDEFAAMLNLSQPQLDAATAALEEMAAGWRGQLVGGLSMAIGCAASREFPSENIAELSRISDERMYAAKEAYYQRTRKPRRT